MKHFNQGKDNTFYNKNKKSGLTLGLLAGMAIGMMVSYLTACTPSQSGIGGTANLPQTEVDKVMMKYAQMDFDKTLLKTFDNGDIVYTPQEKHVVRDKDHAVLYYNNLLLVFTDTDLPEKERQLLAEAVDGRIVGTISRSIHALQIIVPESNLTQLEEKANILMKNENVMYACSEYPVQIMKTESDLNPWDEDGLEEDRGNETNPDGNDWWAEAIGAYTAWQYSDLSEKVKVGIVDDGFYVNHEDLKGQITLVTEYSNNALTGHGTHVAGIIGALNNEVGIRGIVDTAELYCADLWPTETVESYHTMAEFLAVVNYMADNGVKVINNSWGVYTPKEGDFVPPLTQRVEQDLVPTAEVCIVMISQLISSGHEDLMIVQAAGNSSIDARNSGFFARIDEQLFNSMDKSLRDKLSDQDITYERIDERILIVGAVENSTDRYGDYYLSSFSNYGDTVDICAPGSQIYSTVPPRPELYDAYSGTSMAAPMVTGSVALIWSLDPELTVSEIRTILFESAEVVAFADNLDEEYIYPMLNIGSAVEYLLEEYEWMYEDEES